MPDRTQGPLPGRLGFRLMASMGIALLPLALLSYVQATRVETEARARAEAALFGETLMVASLQIEAIKRARGSAAALAVAVPALMGDDAACSRVMRGVRDSNLGSTFVGFIPVDGFMTCASNGAPHQFADTPERMDLLANPRSAMTVNRRGEISGESVLIFSEPVRAADGTLLGFVSLSLPHRTVDPMPDRPAGAGSSPEALVTFDGQGTVLTALYGLDTVAERLPANNRLTDFVGKGAVTFRDTTPSGEQRSFAVVPMVDNELYILSSWTPPTVGAFLGGALPAWGFPVAMWVASLLVAWLAAEYQVLRHIRSLRRSIIRFASGARTVELPPLRTAPSELRDVGDAYERMVTAILHDEAELEDTIHQKEVLLREVHHRVKNNLQLIASIMNIQMRKAHSDESKVLLKGLHDRVMSLATVHRELYQTTGLADVRADELLSRIVGQLERMATVPGRTVRVVTSFDPIRLTPDQAVPLALLLTEALTNVFKHVGRAAAGATVTVSLVREVDGAARLLVENPTPAPAADRTVAPDSTGLGGQLLAAFATQLTGNLIAGEDAEHYRVSVTFPVGALSEAEQRASVAA